METDYLKLAAENQKRAREVIAESQIEQIWQRHGATVNLVGSLATGLLMKHRDIDFHVYTAAEPEVAVSFAAMAELAKNPRIKGLSLPICWTRKTPVWSGTPFMRTGGANCGSLT